MLHGRDEVLRVWERLEGRLRFSSPSLAGVMQGCSHRYGAVLSTSFGDAL